MTNWLLYGATGFTGRLLAQEALRRGHRPVLGGRSEARLQPLAESLGLEYQVFGLERLDALVRAVRDFDLVFHAAGPYIHTADPMMKACALAGRHYLDITGEIPVFEGSTAYDEAMRRQNRAMISGVGFDVVPGNCLAQYVAGQLPEATQLDVAFYAPTGISAGTARSAIAGGAAGGWVRRKGRLIPYPLGTGRRRVRFPNGQFSVVPFPWGDLSASFQSTGIPNITVYGAFSPLLAGMARFGAPIGQFLLSIPPVRSALSGLAGAVFKGPSADQQASNRAYFWAQVADEAGNSAQAWIETPEPYRFTALAGIRAVERTLAENPAGVLAPAQAFGADFPLEIESVARFDTLDNR